MNTQEFIQKAKLVHGDKYDYSKVNYVNSQTKVCIICPEHGEFWQRYSDHLYGRGCKLCMAKNLSKMFRMTQEQFIKDAKQVHGDKYDYSKVNYVNSQTKVCIICPEHGEFWQKPSSHLQGHGCWKCIRSVHDKKSFIRKSQIIHNNKFLYHKIEYVNYETPVCIICPEHGEFWQTPHSHSQGEGCPLCAIEIIKQKSRKTQEQFIKDAKQVHGDKYDYSKVNYVNSQTKVCIICPEHGEFWQKPSSHLQGQGCPICKESKCEKYVRKILIKNNIKFIEQFRTNWLGQQSLDFYLPDYNVAIECQGRQHFEAINYFGGKEGLKKTQERDRLKKILCKQNNIILLEFVIDKRVSLDIGIHDKNILIKKIYEAKQIYNN